MVFFATTKTAPATPTIPAMKAMPFKKSLLAVSYTHLDVYKRQAYNSVSNPKMLFSAGYSFGKFQRMLSDFPMDQLYITITDFHNTPKRLKQLFDTAALDPCGRVKNVESELKFFTDRAERVCELVRMQEKGLIPLRVTHNDTKYNNILIDDDSLEAICVIDLDTVMPGLSCYDFGDARRFCANSAAEDEQDLSKVKLDLNNYTAVSYTHLERETVKIPRC